MALVDYNSSDESGREEQETPKEVPSVKDGQLMNAAPDTVVLKDERALAKINTRPDALTYDEPAGPTNPFEHAQRSLKRKNIITGLAEEEAFNDATFRIQHRTYQMLGYAQDPTTGQFVGDTEKASELGGQVISEIRPSKKTKRELRKKRQKKGDASVLDGDDAYRGPWAEYKDDEASSSAAEYEAESSDEDDEMGPKLIGETKEEKSESESEEEEEEPLETSEFVGSSEVDYLGRTYMHVPQDLDVNLKKTPGEEECFVPKKKIHSWMGHSKGVSKLEFFPNSGHLLLSGGNDTKIKLWDVYHDREHLRTYQGHSKPVKDVTFNPDGTGFLSTAYDKMVKLWDTETGKCLVRFSNGSVANCVKFNPTDPSSFLVGTANHKIVQYDLRTPETVVQEYTHHLGSINSITFVDDNHRFMTSSDDKSIRIWDWGINVPIKFIADPSQYSMPSLRLHPSHKYVAAQSMDNRILVFSAKDKFRQNKRKDFSGFNCAGYSCDIDFSPDGKILMCGESNGNLVFWDWKKTGIISKLKAHNSPVLTLAAHPQETSKVASAGLDGPINYWD
ncbi:hypothetical protein TRICI_006613 [Trichomonascus ciferrii]|uniref:Pre-mRNA-processing factor 17 n=1 Tax=Trichomonascus ciferrii TaxID=44093 RepID=A0A642UG52_9ASCO|nr:hypothetical protein TRICI_006613 [Trichomonascus ciferrii]